MSNVHPLRPNLYHHVNINNIASTFAPFFPYHAHLHYLQHLQHHFHLSALSSIFAHIQQQRVYATSLITRRFMCNKTKSDYWRIQFHNQLLGSDKFWLPSHFCKLRNQVQRVQARFVKRAPLQSTQDFAMKRFHKLTKFGNSSHNI